MLRKGEAVLVDPTALLPHRGPCFVPYSPTFVTALSSRGCLLLAGREEACLLHMYLVTRGLADLDVLPVVFVCNHLLTVGFSGQTIEEETCIITAFFKKRLID